MEKIITILRNTIQPRNDKELCEVDNFDTVKYDALVEDGFMVAKDCPPRESNIEYVYIDGKYLIKKSPTHGVHWLQDDGMKWSYDCDPIYRRLLPPPAEALDHINILHAIIGCSQPADKTYVEYGVSTGRCLTQVAPLVNKSIAVDVHNKVEDMPSNCTFYECTTDEFSASVLPSITYHFAFIDADHAYSSVVKDFNNIYDTIQPGGYIFLHDTYPCAEEYLAPHLCNDCYKTPGHIKKSHKDIEMLTIPIQPGLTIIRKPDSIGGRAEC